MKRALLVTIVVCASMLACVMLATPALRAGAIVDSDFRRQTDWMFLNLNVTSTQSRIPDQKITPLAIGRVKKAVALPAAIDISRPEYAIRTTRESNHTDWDFKVRLKGAARHNANLIKALMPKLREIGGPGLITLNGSGLDGSTIDVSIGDFSGAGSAAGPVDMGISIQDRKQ